MNDSTREPRQPPADQPTDRATDPPMFDRDAETALTERWRDRRRAARQLDRVLARAAS